MMDDTGQQAPDGATPERPIPDGLHTEEPVESRPPASDAAETQAPAANDVTSLDPSARPDSNTPAPGSASPTETQPADAEPKLAPAPRREPDEEALRLAEALVFSSAEPTTPRSLARILPDDIEAEAVIAALRVRYAGRGVELVDAGPGVMFRTAVDLAPKLRKVIESPRRLPRVAMETLAIIAYHQPMTRPEIEHIRGSALSQQTLDSLLELSLIAPKGRRESPGRPTLWGTTPEFLAHFGLKDLRELPRREDLLLEPSPPRPEAVTPDLQSPPDVDSTKTGV
jgi:segregation and condensation protein B